MLVQKKLPMDMDSCCYICQTVSGDRSTKTGLALWDNIKGMKANYFASDYWKSYEKFIPADRHLQTKAETYTV